MKKLHNIFVSLAAGMAVAFALAGCSSKDVTLPAQLDMLPGEDVALIDVAKYTGTEMVGAADTLKLLSEAQSQDSALEFVFDSDKPSVAKVSDQGVITAYSVGDANITASCESLDFKAEIAVHVRGYATELDVDDTVRLEEGDTHTLTTTVDGPVTVTYESASPAIATVDEDGVITAVRNGETTITASIPGSSLKDTCVVTVGTAVQSISLSSAAATLTPGERMRLVAGTWPTVDTATRWKTSDADVATVDDGMVTAVGEGTAEITAMVAGKEATCTVTVVLPATPESAQATPETATSETATPETATPETAAEETEKQATPETAMTESDFDISELPENTEPAEENLAATEDTVEEEKPASLEDYIQEFLDAYNAPEQELPALQFMGPGPVVSTATPETATPETATPETATPETATPETATPETATPETATPESAEKLLGDVAEKTGGFFSNIFKELGSFFGF